MKRCGRCKIYKDESEFYKNRSRKDGYNPYCKDCHKAYYETENGKASRHRWSISEKKKIHDKRFLLTEQGKISRYIHATKYDHNNRDKRRAHCAVNRAIKAGILPKASTLKCSYVGCEQQAREYHHSSYELNKRLDVIPYCSLHHREIDRWATFSLPNQNFTRCM